MTRIASTDVTVTWTHVHTPAKDPVSDMVALSGPWTLRSLLYQNILPSSTWNGSWLLRNLCSRRRLRPQRLEDLSIYLVDVLWSTAPQPLSNYLASIIVPCDIIGLLQVAVLLLGGVSVEAPYWVQFGKPRALLLYTETRSPGIAALPEHRNIYKLCWKSSIISQRYEHSQKSVMWRALRFCSQYAGLVKPV